MQAFVWHPSGAREPHGVDQLQRHSIDDERLVAGFLLDAWSPVEEPRVDQLCPEVDRLNDMGIGRDHGVSGHPVLLLASGTLTLCCQPDFFCSEPALAGV
jgi:hypothetical protein